MPVVELFDWVGGKKTRRRGRPTDAKRETVAVVTPNVVDAFLGARNRRERTEHLRDLRDRGLLICGPGRLTQKVRGLSRRAYVFRGDADRVPRCRRRS